MNNYILKRDKTKIKAIKWKKKKKDVCIESN